MNQKRDSKKRAIACGALRLFAAKGIEATTTRDISKASKAAEGTIYRHFSGKEQLAISLFVDCASQFTDFLRRSVDGAAGPEQKIKALIEAFCQFARSHADSYSYVLFAHHVAFRKLPKDMPKPKDVFVEVIAQGIKKRLFRDIDENLAAAMIIGMCIRVIFFSDNRLIELSREALVEELTRSSLAILGVETKD